MQGLSPFFGRPWKFGDLRSQWNPQLFCNVLYRLSKLYDEQGHRQLVDSGWRKIFVEAHYEVETMLSWNCDESQTALRFFPTILFSVTCFYMFYSISTVFWWRSCWHKGYNAGGFVLTESAGAVNIEVENLFKARKLKSWGCSTHIKVRIDIWMQLQLCAVRRLFKNGLAFHQPYLFRSFDYLIKSDSLSPSQCFDTSFLDGLKVLRSDSRSQGIAACQPQKTHQRRVGEQCVAQMPDGTVPPYQVACWIHNSNSPFGARFNPISLVCEGVGKSKSLTHLQLDVIACVPCECIRQTKSMEWRWLWMGIFIVAGFF